MSVPTPKPGDRADSDEAMSAQLSAGMQYVTRKGLIVGDKNGVPKTKPVSAAFVGRLMSWVKQREAAVTS